MKKSRLILLCLCLLLCTAAAWKLCGFSHSSAVHKGGPEAAAPGRFERRPSGRHLDEFLSRFPEEDRARLKKLAEEDPQAFRKEMQTYFEARRKKDLEKLKALRQAYFDAPEGEEKKKAEEALRSELRTGFQRFVNGSERRIRDMEMQLADFQKRLDQAKKKHEEQKQNMEKEIERMLSDLTDPAKDPFRMPSPPDPSAPKTGPSGR